jgi:hypothetical protein
MSSFPDMLDTFDYLVPMCIHIDKGPLARLGKRKIPSRRAIPGSFGVTCYQAICLQPGENGIDIAFANFQSLRPLEHLNHLVAVTSVLLQKVQNDNVKQSFAKLSLPIVKIHTSPLFLGFRSIVKTDYLIPFPVYYIPVQ